MNVPTTLRAVDEQGRYAGTLHVLGPAFGGYAVRWAGSRQEWTATEAELQRLTTPRRVRA